MVIETTTKYTGYYNSAYLNDDGTVIEQNVVRIIDNIKAVKGYDAEIGDCLLTLSTDGKSHVYKVTGVTTPAITVVDITPTITNDGSNIIFRFYAIRDDSENGGNNIYIANGAGNEPIIKTDVFKSDGYFIGSIVSGLPVDTTDYVNGDIISINDNVYNGSLLIYDGTKFDQLVTCLNDCTFYDKTKSITKYIGSIGKLSEYFYALNDYTGYFYTNILEADLLTTKTIYKKNTYVLVFNDNGPEKGANLYVSKGSTYTNLTGDTYYKYIFRDNISSNIYLIDLSGADNKITIITSGNKVDAAVVSGYVNLNYSDEAMSKNLFKSTTQAFTQNLSDIDKDIVDFVKQPPAIAKVIIGDLATSPTLKVSYVNSIWSFDSSVITPGESKTVIFEYPEDGSNVTLIYLLSRSASSVFAKVEFSGNLDLSELPGEEISEHYNIVNGTDGIVVPSGTGRYKVMEDGNYQLTAVINYAFPSLVNDSVKNPDSNPPIYYNTNFQIYNEGDDTVLSTSMIPQTRFNGITNGSSSGFISQGQVYIITIASLIQNQQIYLRYIPDELATTITFDNNYMSTLTIIKL